MGGVYYLCLCYNSHSDDVEKEVKWVFIVIMWYGVDVAPKGVVIDSPDESSCVALRTFYEEMLTKQEEEDELIGFFLTECEEE